jgi:hypothetical protein
MKWWRRFLDRFKKTHCTVEFRTKPYWSNVVFNVPFRVVPACDDVIHIYRRDWRVSEVDAYDDGTPRLTVEPI